MRLLSDIFLTKEIFNVKDGSIMTDQDIFYEYERVLLGKRKNYSSEIFAGNSAAGKEEIALRFFRCIFEKYFGWTPEEAYHNLNKNIMEKMKLLPLIRFIKFPPEFDPMNDCFYIVAKAYPNKFKIDEVKQTKIVYNRVLNGEVSRFPKFFFEGRGGYMRALFCLQYAIREFTAFKTAEEMYKYFAFYGTDFLKKYKLWEAYKMNFTELPIKYLNECMNVYSKYEYSLLYAKYNVLAQYKEFCKKKIKEERAAQRAEKERVKEENLLREEFKKPFETANVEQMFFEDVFEKNPPLEFLNSFRT
jgi:hypothetical protein